VVPKKYRNYVLLLFSLLFYFLGEPKYIVILLLSCIINYYLSKLIDKSKKVKRRRYLILGIVYNIGQLLFFKYTNFFIANINSLFNSNIGIIKIVMPIGISFFTFQAMGYVFDIYGSCVYRYSVYNFATLLS
jgi:alginate O-acetyltransferase complex protein AlgI